MTLISTIASELLPETLPVLELSLGYWSAMISSSSLSAKSVTVQIQTLTYKQSHITNAKWYFPFSKFVAIWSLQNIYLSALACNYSDNECDKGHLMLKMKRCCAALWKVLNVSIILFYVYGCSFSSEVAITWKRYYKTDTLQPMQLLNARIHKVRAILYLHKIITNIIHSLWNIPSYQNLT